VNSFIIRITVNVKNIAHLDGAGKDYVGSIRALLQLHYRDIHPKSNTCRRIHSLKIYIIA
jgi:hypothetical protein